MHVIDAILENYVACAGTLMPTVPDASRTGRPVFTVALSVDGNPSSQVTIARKEVEVQPLDQKLVMLSTRRQLMLTSLNSASLSSLVARQMLLFVLL